MLGEIAEKLQVTPAAFVLPLKTVKKRRLSIRI